MTGDQKVLFSGGKSVDEVRIEAAKEILVKAGYRILDPIVVNEKITTKKQLVEYFYMRLYSKYPDRQTMQRHPNKLNYDMNTVKRFIDTHTDGANEQRAIQECVAVIDTLFDYEDEFNFKYPITDIGILGQGKMAWITKKALDILNKKKYEALEAEVVKRTDKIENDTEIDAEEINTNLDKLLKKMEANNG